MKAGSTVGPDGRYRVEAELGRGGMGAVFQAHDTVLDRSVAVKLLRDDLASNPEFRVRLDREARIMASLAHPNLVRVFDADLTAHPPFLVLELLQGRPLNRMIHDGGALPLPTIRALVLQLGDALAHLHERRTLHRDLKPANVFILPDGSPRLLDFGLARPVDGTRLTAEGIPVGTLAFMAPETLNGKPTGPKADVYGLGMTLLTAALGHLPLGEGTTAPALIARIAAHDGEPDFVPSTLPPDLRRLFCAMLHGDPTRRPAAGTEMRELMSTSPRTAPPAPPPKAAAAARPPRRSTALLLLPLLVLLVILLVRPAPPPAGPISAPSPHPTTDHPAVTGELDPLALADRLAGFDPRSITAGLADGLAQNLGDIFIQFSANQMAQDQIILTVPSLKEAQRLRAARRQAADLIDSRLSASPYRADLERAVRLSSSVLGDRGRPFAIRRRLYESLVPLVELTLFVDLYGLRVERLPRPDLAEFGTPPHPLSDPDEVIRVLDATHPPVILGRPSPLTPVGARMSWTTGVALSDGEAPEAAELVVTAQNFPAAAMAVTVNDGPRLYARGVPGLPRWFPQTVALSVPPELLHAGANRLTLAWESGLDRRSILADSNPITHLALRLRRRARRED